MATQSDDCSVNQQIIKLCSDFLGWSSPEDISIQRIEEGRSNRVFRCWINDHNSNLNQVIVRFYGNDFIKGTADFKDSREKEVLISYIFSEKQLGPKLIGIFDGGRIEEFIQSTKPSREQYEGPSMFEILASKMATIHSLRLPFSRHVNLESNLISLVSNLKSSSTLSKYRSGCKVNQWSEKLCSFDYCQEVEWLVSLFDSIPSKVVFCHKDLNRSNILIRTRNSSDYESRNQNPGSKVMIIDYEYSDYAYRWADIATFFSEIANCRWKESQSAPFKLFDYYPSPKRRSFFLRHYCGQLANLQSLDGNDLEQETINLTREVDFGAMIVNLVNCLWRLCHPRIDQESLSFLWEEANFRFDLYIGHKEYFINNHNAYS